MASFASQYELAALPELEGEYEAGAESESQEFSQAIRAFTQAHRQNVLNTTHRVLRGAAKNAPEMGRLIGRSLPLLPVAHHLGIEPDTGFQIGENLGNYAAQVLGNLDLRIPQKESEGEISPVRKWYPDAMLEHLGHSAAEAESQEEAESYLGAMIPLAARLCPGAASVLARSAPNLISGAVAAMNAFRQNPQTRPLVRLMPAIVRRTAKSIAHRTAQGVPVRPAQAVKTLARETYRILSSPQAATQVFRRSQLMDRRFHSSGGSLPKPHCHNCGAYRAR